MTVLSAALSPISVRVDYEVTGEIQAQEDDNGLPEVGGVVLKEGSRLLYLLDGGQIGYGRLKKQRRSTITDLLRMTDTGGVHMEEYRLCNSDYRFMTLVWEHGPIGSGELVRLCAEYLGWKKSTTYTEIKRVRRAF